MKTLLSLLLLLSLPAVQAAPKVMVSILPQKFLVERLAGDALEVSVMVGPGQSPATYEPNPRRMAELERAALYYRIGVPFEQIWLPRIRAENPNLPLADAREGIELRPIEGHAHQDGHDGHGGHDEDREAGRMDPHIWLSPPLMRTMAAKLAERLRGLWPERAGRFDDNLKALDADLAALDAEIRATIEHSGVQRFMVFHPSWGYFADAYGLQQIPIEQEGKEPGAKSLARLIDRARAAEIDVIFVQQQFGQQQARALAQAVDARVATLDPLAADYLENMRAIARAIAGGAP